MELMLNRVGRAVTVTNRSLLPVAVRSFGKPGGPPGQGPPATPYKRPTTMLEDFVAQGHDFILGGPKHPQKIYNAPRDAFIHKMTPRIDVYAKKLREMYHRKGTISHVKHFIDPLRMRTPQDSIKACMEQNLVPGVIEGREEFDDFDAVWSCRIPARVLAADHPYMQPFYVRHPETEEEIRVTCKEIKRHPKTVKPYMINFQRYIVGRPNLLQIPIFPVQYEKSLHFIAGADF